MKPLLDERFPVHEQLPRELIVKVCEITDRGVLQALITMEDGRPIGDCVTDDSDPPDGYRFHDAFHLGCAAILGWSPVTRRNLHRKRRSSPSVDRIEDGGRACAVEEGISQMVFTYAKRASMFQEAKQINPTLLSIIKDLTSHLEVSVRSEQDWEKAILNSYAVFRCLLQNKGGFVHLDMREGVIRYRL